MEDFFYHDIPYVQDLKIRLRTVILIRLARLINTAIMIIFDNEKDKKCLHEVASNYICFQIDSIIK
jgi:hypothetical protein